MYVYKVLTCVKMSLRKRDVLKWKRMVRAICQTYIIMSRFTLVNVDNFIQKFAILLVSWFLQSAKMCANHQSVLSIKQLILLVSGPCNIYIYIAFLG